ncbi:MAG: phenylacetate--CoA ligase [Firmicutes bacterium]|nr:phenylacetate--CoA ligase [Bacillota bacterium]
MYWNKEFETMPWQEVQNYCLSKFPAFLEYLKNNSQFYKDRLSSIKSEDIKTLDDLKSIPFLTKNDLRDAQADTDRKNPLGKIQVVDTEDIVQVISSSGTSGRPVYYGATKKDLGIWNDAIANVYYTAGVRKGDIVAHTTGIPLFAGGSSYFEGIRNIEAMTVWPGNLSTSRMLETIRNLHCNVIQATVSFNLYLAERCQDALGVDPRDLGITNIIGGGEPGLGEEAIRQKLKDAWNAKTVREIMGLADVMPAMWGECEEETGMHFNAQKYVMIELIDPETEEHLPWEAGVVGEVVYTNFSRGATPILRYRSADLVRLEGMSCPCGRTSPKIRCIGRADDLIIFKAMNVYPSAIRDVVLTHYKEHLTGQMQVVKDSPEQVRFDTAIPVDIETTLPEEKQADLKQKIESIVRDTLNIRVEANLVPPETIQRTQYKSPLIRIREKDEQ